MEFGVLQTGENVFQLYHLNQCLFGSDNARSGTLEKVGCESEKEIGFYDLRTMQTPRSNDTFFRLLSSFNPFVQDGTLRNLPWGAFARDIETGQRI